MMDAAPLHSREAIAELLRQNDINPTHQRIEIAYALFSRRQHLSAEQVMGIVNARVPECSKATIYNTLNLLREKRMIREVVVDPAKVFYDPNTSEHHHLYDVVRGTLVDIPAGEIEVKGMPHLPEGMTAESVDIVVRVRPSES